MAQTTRRTDAPPTFEQLQAEHTSLERRLEKLKRPRSLSPEEAMEIQEIKKRKLQIKDEMMSLQAAP